MGILVVGLIIPTSVLADVAAPKKQTNLGVSQDKVVCKENLFKIILKSNGKALCVKPSSAIKMIERGLTKSTSTDLAKTFMDETKNKSPVGNVKKIAVLGIEAGSKIFRSTPPFTSYKVIFEICANDFPLIAPEVILASQTATNYVKIANNFPENTFEINAGTVAAINPETIEVTLVNQGGVTKKINQLQNTVSDLKQKLESEKSKLSARVEEGDIDKQRERISSISQLRTELNYAKEELNRYLFALNLTPKIKTQDLAIPKTFTGIPIEGVTVTKLAANKQLVQDGYDVAFEMCAASQMVRLPIVTVSSDMESKTVKLADRIIPNTCQVTGAKIKASSADTIKVSIGDTAEKSAIVVGLEKKISELTDSLQAEKLTLKNLIHLAPRPSDFNDQAAKIAENVINLRSEINLLKVQLYSILNDVYK